ncbi:Gfo/Idh/MocA family oxidoreductase [Roseisolibacter sp. H3M3-2]|uniref:Gfo/Idh/MocA family oxidoreductase n=1 Tax=Roseisolibacter sp. H3M3-2 TaxID=3031323 RepID=UPI0023DC598E|nr:Gfo/Idh/MocA family oxidoreductase [Roseisolibacter sp. H3M3-2]MDF1502645.1 Gfo/Idh/MocA family oxidoreductase [Roseisolibacter sp. H3M3-2]
MAAEPRVGVVGAGALGYHHVRLLRDLPGARFAGFYERSEARRAQVASELGVPAFDSLDALLDAADALTVVVPTPAHHAVARAALERGRHLLIEKPITTTLEEADELLAIAARTGAVVQTGHVERFNRAVRAALPYVDAPRFIESDRLAPFTMRGADVAVVLDLMIHDIDLVRTLVGSAVSEVRATGVGVLTPTVDIANARLAFASGAVANITASRVSRERLRKVRIFQQSGYLSLDLAAGNGEFFRLRGDVDLAALAMRMAAGGGAPAGPLDLAAFVERVPLEAPEGEPLRLEFESFVAAVRGEAPPVVSGGDGREAPDVALRMVGEIERTLPALRDAAAGATAP